MGVPPTAFVSVQSSKDRETPPVYDATDLTRGGNVAHIVLRDQTYTLRITRAGKLILNK